jgi:V/A-type H+/Na+-transporting ATPase subunit K
MRKILVLALLSLALLPLATVALAQVHGAAVPATQAQPVVPAADNNSIVIWKALGAALAIGFAAFATAMAQSKIGSAAAGAMAEKPEIGGVMIVLEALPETIIILGFVIAIMIVGIK